MKFRTEVEINASGKKIDYSTPVILTGSCFAEEIGRQFSYGKLPVLTNPFGVLYNPFSTAHSLELIMEGREYREDDLFKYEGRYLSFSHDTGFSSRDPEESLDKINRSLRAANIFLEEASFLFITFGTAWVYRWKDDNRVVANCHKIPAAKFSRQLLKQEDISSRWLDIIERLRNFNSELKIVFTISPVRHLKDGAHGNQLSKSTLLLAINELVNQNNSLSYFPSFEIMLDELRDYRFYKKDMVHPSESAVDYMWEKFSQSYFTEETAGIYERVKKISSATEHILMGNDDVDLKRFSRSMLDKIENLRNDYPFVDLVREEEYFRNILK
ncbi:MAG: GSCFA domain-containing protein [Bacteroidales bacterium]|jgi:hypothetical protein|nr:GSCFA domain-containing protein [Bacteroidales bacterium]